MSNISVYKKIKYYIDGNTTIQTYRNNFHQILANCRLRLSLLSETPKHQKQRVWQWNATVAPSTGQEGEV